jgi:hypothetical protein
LGRDLPGDNESAGKRRRGGIRKGDRWLKTALIEAALAAIRVKGSALGGALPSTVLAISEEFSSRCRSSTNLRRPNSL